MRTVLSVATVLVTITSYTEAGNTVYVDADATGPVHDGSSWCSAYPDLQQAIAVAVAGTEIRIAQGVYRPAPVGGSRDAAFVVPTDITLLGSFQGCGTPDPNERDYIIYATVLSGDLAGNDDPNFANRTDNVYHVVTTHNVSAATVLDGLTIRGGHADGPNVGPSVDSKDQGSGVNNYHGQPTLSNCTLIDNYSTNHGAFNNHGSATLIDCEFRDNWSGNVAAGLYMHFDTDTTVIDCEFHDNTTAGKGGGAYLKGDSAPTFSGCLFSGNNALHGGGMYCDSNNSPTLTNCTFNNNEAESDSARGGGVYAQESNLDLSGCTFQGNQTSGAGAGGGGAIYIENGSLQLDQCDFLRNRSGWSLSGPGGVYLNDSTATITRCLFDDNSSSRYGGAMRNSGSGVTVEDCVFTQNHSYWGSVFNSAPVDFSRCRFTDSSGAYGAIHGACNLSDCVFLNNRANQWNGAALSSWNGLAVNTLFAGNVAAVDGGAISGAQVTLINCVFSGNSAGSSGGAILLQGGISHPQSTISNCTFFGNSADSGRAISIDSFGPTFRHDLFMDNSILWDGGSEIWGAGSSAVNTTITYTNIETGWGGVGNMAVNPLFVDPDGDDDLPGTEDDNLRLLDGSPSVNAGDNNAVLSTTDADGMQRIAFGVVDMGAFEVQEPLESPAPPAPWHNFRKNRYISIDPRGATGVNMGRDFDIRATLTSTLVNGVTAVDSQWWANAPDENCISIVGPSRPSVPPNWDACSTLHLTGCPILPTSTYSIVAIALEDVSPDMLASTQVKPGAKWHGDAVGFFDGSTDTWTPPQGTVNIDDAVAAILTFKNPSAFNATHVSVTDVHPNLSGMQINKVVNFDDVFVQILGFQGNEYPGTQIELCPDP